MTKKKKRSILSRIGEGFQLGGAAYKGVLTGKGLSNAKNLRKDQLKTQTKVGTTRSRMEAANKLRMGEDMVASIKKRAKASKDDKARMQRLKKNNPAKYKEEKRKRRAAAMIAERNKKSWERD